MRIRLTFLPPLPPLKCWYPVSKEECKTVNRLSEGIAHDFNIEHPLFLEMEGFRLMPRSNLSGLLKDKDLITVKPIVDDESDIIHRDRRKRKASIIESESDSEPEITRKKVKRSKKAVHAKDTKAKEEAKRQRKLERKLSKAAKLKSKEKSKEKPASSKSPAQRQAQISSQSTKVSDLPKSNTIEKPTASSHNRIANEKTIPGEGSTKTRSRNERRRRLKKAMEGQFQDTKENQPMIQQPQPIASNQEPEIFKSHVLQPAEQNGLVPSSSLLKKNRNKKRGFLNDIEKEPPKEHIRFQPPQANPSELVGGTAVITSIDLDPGPSDGGGYNLRSKTEKKFPVQKAPRVVRASQISAESGVEDLEGNTWVDDAVDYASDDNEADNGRTVPMAYTAIESADMDEVIDYNACEVVNFTTNLPEELDVLAIKTLVLSATYTPEISDWREVVVKEIDIIDGTITVEHLGVTDKALREGGRFELGANEETEAENYDDDDSIVTLLKSDIVDMRRIR
ncbi:hypothetical protein K450DRAFT_219853 [Umbelopsis ramanniana AG]|uniref:Coilin n=1 Tax=Umbelopsis ramanniana AG TaxID=1314678 RepID=A0AAD5HGR2_UMBRA|nr:uncharacterized protein K450DRAFT_219853 [Umbelopsis ramanniana AG]KAI8583755.1 hypothetical protein K450DRAFT_219853 [Umbelopsis ramanniana AG]